MNYVAAAVKNVFDRKDTIKKGYVIKQEREILRHFTVQLEKA